MKDGAHPLNDLVMNKNGGGCRMMNDDELVEIKWRHDCLCDIFTFVTNNTPQTSLRRYSPNFLNGFICSNDNK
jgi:hypothetical protein